MSSMDYLNLKTKLQEFILQEGCTAEEFNLMAKEIFTFQYANNAAYQKFCRRRRMSPAKVKTYLDIPAVPINAFKETELSCCEPAEAQAVFMTSGTTSGQRGKNFHRDLEIYDLSMQRFFKACIMPEVEKLKMAVLFPSAGEMPNSSLAHYLGLAKELFGTKDSQYFVTNQGFDLQGLQQFLAAAEQGSEPVLIIGATYSFIHFLDHCLEQGTSYKLPQGSRIMDTGGTKSRSREMEQTELKLSLSKFFGVPPYACLNMYGMTELSSQFYDLDLREQVRGREFSSKKIAPHWMRTVVMDPELMEPKPEGEQGILVHYDLANINSVLAILTEDLGVAEGEGFHLLGRAEGTETKGCSLAVEQIVTGEAL